MDADALGELLDELGLELELNSVAVAIQPVVAQLMAGPPDAGLDRAAGDAAEAIWDEELASELASSFAELREELGTEVEELLRELERPPRESLVARTLVFRAALDLISRANRNYERMEKLDSELRGAPPQEYRPRALPIAAAAIPSASIGPEEADKAAAEFVESFPADWENANDAATAATHRLARMLGTDERRRNMRAALAELGDASAEDFPRAVSALHALLEEPMPEDPADDDLWVNLVIGLVQEQLGDFLDDLEREL